MVPEVVFDYKFALDLLIKLSQFILDNIYGHGLYEPRVDHTERLNLVRFVIFPVTLKIG